MIINVQNDEIISEGHVILVRVLVMKKIKN